MSETTLRSGDDKVDLEFLTVHISYFISFDHLRNKFDFLSVHEILNISGPLQSTLTLQETKLFLIP